VVGREVTVVQFPNWRILLVAFDLVETFVFAISGAIAGARHRLDLFGVLVLSIAAATFGGVTRDGLIGAACSARHVDRHWRRHSTGRTRVGRSHRPACRHLRYRALAGATVFVIGHQFHLPSTPIAIAGSLLCFGIRMFAINRGWQFPLARTGGQPRE